MRLLLVINFCALTFILGVCAIPQNNFKLYKDIEKEYLESGNTKALLNHYYPYHIMLLDSTYKDVFIKYFPDFDIGFRYYLNLIVPDKKTVGFETSATDITEIFDSPVLLNKVYGCIRGPFRYQIEYQRITSPILVKENSAIAIFSGPSYHDSYYFKLEENVVQIFWLDGAIE